MHEPDSNGRIQLKDIFLRPVLLTAIRIAIVVGTILALINHGSAILAMDLNEVQLMQIGLTYLVPYAVSTYSSISMLARQRSSPV